MRMTALSAGHIENSRADRQAQQLDESRCFVSIALRCKERPVLQEIMGVESGLPPLARLAQKNTGSR